MTPLETYLTELRDIRSSGAAVKETSYYPALSNLLNEVGKRLKPRVRCIINLANRGAGLPDGGLFTAEQFQKPSEAEPLPGQLPARGVIEVKSTRDDAWITADGEQVSRYWGQYRQVLVTNYRDFVLVGQDAEGKFAKLESFRFAESERAFWAAAVHPRSLAEKIGGRFEEYLLRVMRHAAQLAAPEDVAWFLASYARDARARIEHVDLPALATVRTALEEALGLKFEGEKGEHFFRSSLVQTLFYGVFSAWVLWAKQNPTASKARFDWGLTARYLRVPMISKLFHLVADQQELEALTLTEVLDWATSVLNRVDRAAFFNKFQESHAVQYFYEPFLEAFDPELRKELGVWYTPPEIVKYMVERVDTVLREELNLPDGLANKNVYVLDPCCGTGSYLVEVLDRIHRTLAEKGEGALLASDLKDAARNRVFGFEILPAPFVVAHLQLGLLLQNLDAPLSDKARERVGVYLTNALTGWEPPKGPKKKLLFPELEEERDAAEHVKREVPILVILGNPPYNAFAGVSPEEEQGLVEPYKEGLITEWGIKKFNLDDLYVRFFRLAERRITEMTGKGIVSFISNYSWVSEPSFVVMRQHLLASFDRFWVENMHGNRKISEYAPDGRTSETIFAIPGFSVGIQQGVVVSLWVKSGKPAGKQQVLFREDLNAARALERRAQLLESLKAKDFGAHYQAAHPNKGNRYSFRPEQVTEEYGAWPKATEFSSVTPFNGPVERRSNSLIVFQDQRSRLELVADFLDPEKSDEQVRSIAPAFMESSGEFNASRTRKNLKGRVKYDAAKIVPYPFKPFDVRIAYLDASIQPLFSRPSPDLLAQRDIPGNAFFITRDTADKFPEGPPFYFSKLVCDYDCISGHARHFPVRIVPAKKKKRKAHPAQAELPHPPTTAPPLPKSNLSAQARLYIDGLGFGDPDVDPGVGESLWLHALAIGYSPAYLSENADGIRRDWPRIPLPDSKEALLASAALGKQIAALVDTETDVGAVREPPLQRTGTFTLPHGTTLDEAKHFAITAGWGHAGQGGITMPGKGKIVARDYTPEERVAAGLPRHPNNGDVKSPLLGGRTCDVYLNDVAHWSNIPLRVWEYTIGGYQVMKKWLSYREEKLLGRPLTKDEVRYVQEMARRIAALLLLEPKLDENYREVKEHSYNWPNGE
jgi:hypothetical protein